MRSNVSVHADTTAYFSTCSIFLSHGNQKLLLPISRLHVDMTSLFPSLDMCMCVCL